MFIFRLKKIENSRVTLNVALDGQGQMDVLNYEPGDHIGIFAPNRKEFVDTVLARTANSPGEDQIFNIEVLKEVNTVMGNYIKIFYNAEFNVSFCFKN